METADVRKGRGMWKKRESCLGIWVAWLEEEEKQPARKSEKGQGWGEGREGHTLAGSERSIICRFVSFYLSFPICFESYSPVSFHDL